jgi:hypothetical protein
MIDPLGPDPTDPALPPRQVGEIVSEFEIPGPIKPRVRYANYDSPQASVRPESVSEPKAAAEANRISRSAKASHATTGEPLPNLEKVRKGAASTPASKPVQTALARPVPPMHKPSKLERAIGMARTVLPLVGKVLPLLEGNVVSAAANLLAGHPVEVNLKPLEEAISSLQSDQRALAFHTSEQKRALRRLEDEFATLQEAVQKQAEVQAELAGHMAKLAKGTASFNRLVVILLVILTLFTAFLCVRIAYLIHP